MPVSMADVPPLPVGRGVEPPPLPPSPAFVFHPKRDIGAAWTLVADGVLLAAGLALGHFAWRGNIAAVIGIAVAPSLLGALIGGLAAVAVKARFRVAWLVAWTVLLALCALGCMGSAGFPPPATAVAPASGWHPGSE
jgi:hypothetical protein